VHPKDAARAAGGSPCLLQIFTRSKDHSDPGYLTRVIRLRRSHYSIARIAEELGYESDSAFSQAFRRETGTSPLRFRKAPKIELQTQPTPLYELARVG
jgi:AraC-like DNA-binding protein